MRFTRKFPPKQAEKPKTREPLAERIVPVTQKGRRDWALMNNGELVEYAQKFVEEKGIRRKSVFRNEDRGLYQALLRRGLLDRLDFAGGQRAWSNYSDFELAGYAQNFVDGGGIDSREGFKKADGGLYEALRRRGLLDRLGFKADERAWGRYSDDELVSFTQRLFEEKEIGNRSGLEREDNGLYTALRRRGLLDRALPLTPTGRRKWAAMSNEEIIAHARKFMEERKITGRSELNEADSGLWQVLRARNLLDSVEFKEKLRNWSAMEDDELVAYAKKLMEENGVSGRMELFATYSGLYQILLRRGLLDNVGFEKRKRTERNWTAMSDDKLVEYAKQAVAEKGIRTRTQLRNADSGLYSALITRKLMNGVGFDNTRRPNRNWAAMSDDKLIDYANNFIKEHRTAGRLALKKADRGLHAILGKRNLLDKVFSELEARNENDGLQELKEAMDEFSDE